MKTQEYYKNYAEGYILGTAEHRDGKTMSIVSATCPSDLFPGYAKGYIDGFHGSPKPRGREDLITNQED